MNNLEQEHTHPEKDIEKGKLIIAEPLIRCANIKWVKRDKTITWQAFRPRPRADSATGLEANISTQLRSCHNTEESLRILNSKWGKMVLIEINSSHPNSKGYPCINDKGCHVGFTGDMVALNKDEKTMQFFADNSTLLYPIS